MHREDYTVAKLDWHTSAECQTLLGVTKNQWISKKGGSFEPQRTPLDLPLQFLLLLPEVKYDEWLLIKGFVFGQSRLIDNHHRSTSTTSSGHSGRDDVSQS